MKLLKEKLNRKAEEENNLGKKINSVEKLKIEHTANIILKDEKIESLIKQIGELAERNKMLSNQQPENKAEKSWQKEERKVQGIQEKNKL